MQQAKKDYSGKSIEFVTFNFTDDATTKAAEADAKKFGVEEIYAANAPKTGFVLLVDSKSKKVVGKLGVGQKPDVWNASIDKLLGS